MYGIISVKFLFGGSAGMAATMFVQPLDLVKNRMQVSRESIKIPVPRRLFITALQ
jgi:hypothetical protein